MDDNPDMSSSSNGGVDLGDEDSDDDSDLFDRVDGNDSDSTNEGSTKFHFVFSSSEDEDLSEVSAVFYSDGEHSA